MSSGGAHTLVLGALLPPRAHTRRAAHGRQAWALGAQLGWSAGRAALRADGYFGRSFGAPRPKLRNLSDSGQVRRGAQPARPHTAALRPCLVAGVSARRRAAVGHSAWGALPTVQVPPLCLGIPPPGPADQPRGACTRPQPCRQLYRVGAWRPGWRRAVGLAVERCRRQQPQQAAAPGTRGCRTHRCVAPPLRRTLGPSGTRGGRAGVPAGRHSAWIWALWRLNTLLEAKAFHPDRRDAFPPTRSPTLRRRPRRRTPQGVGASAGGSARAMAASRGAARCH